MTSQEMSPLDSASNEVVYDLELTDPTPSNQGAHPTLGNCPNRLHVFLANHLLRDDVESEQALRVEGQF